MSFSGLDSDDEAPEDVSFSTGRESALHDLEIAKIERKKGNKEVKEWRRKRDELYKKQKESKLLSLDILMKADEELKRKRSFEEKQEISDEDNASSGDNDSEDEKLNDMSAEQQDAYQKVMVAVIDVKEPRPLMQSALDFKKTNLYGKRIKRMDVSDWRAIRLKSRNRK
ncbi:uncharacterized protein LOC120325741 [Styela clava]